MKIKRIQILICLLIIIISSTSSYSAVKEPVTSDLHGSLILYVGGDGPGNYSKIQDAIDDSDNGDIVFVYNDSSPYYENLRISKSITLVGEDRNTTVINGNTSKNVISINDAGFVSICYFTIGNGHDGIYIGGSGSSNNTISGNIIRYNVENGLHIKKYNGQDDNNIIKNNIISNNKNGVYCDYSSRNIIVDNEISRNYFNGICLDISSRNNITGNTIVDNVGLDNLNKFRAGINCYCSDENTIYNNNISHNHGSGLFLLGSDNNNITKNIISFNFEEVWYDDSYGIYIAGYGNIIKNNSILNNSDSGIYLFGVNGNHIIMNNNISSNSPGIYLSCPNNIISSNTFFSNKDNYLRNIGIDIDSSNNHIIENRFIDNGIRIFDKTCQNNLSNNKINGKPLVYLVGQSNKTIENAGQIVLISCDNISIENQNILNIYAGITLINTNKCCIIGNNFSSTYYGINLGESSDNNTIQDNDFYSNKNGIFISSSVHNEIIDNNLSIDWTAIGLYNASYSILKDNIIKSAEYGIKIFDSDNNCINNNSLSNNPQGIQISWSHFNIILENQVLDSNEVGIAVYESHNNNIINNNMSNNKRGIYFYLSDNNNVVENNFINNKRNALFMNCTNTWDKNYWSHPKILPKIIKGKIRIKYSPWFNIDWRPALRPYDI